MVAAPATSSAAGTNNFEVGFYYAFTENLNLTLIYDVQQCGHVTASAIVHLHNKKVHRTTIRRSIHNI
jgi:predicted porin